MKKWQKNPGIWHKIPCCVWGSHLFTGVLCAIRNGLEITYVTLPKQGRSPCQIAYTDSKFWIGNFGLPVWAFAGLPAIAFLALLTLLALFRRIDSSHPSWAFRR